MASRVRARIFILLTVTLFLFFVAAAPAHAIDKRLKMGFKTAGYGAAAGFVAGGASWVLGLGDYRNMLIGASVGLYAGILLAVYVVATAEEGHASQGPANPFSPREPVGPNDWEQEPEDDDQGSVRSLSGNLVAGALRPSHWEWPRSADHWGMPGARSGFAGAGVVVWTPVLALAF